MGVEKGSRQQEKEVASGFKKKNKKTLAGSGFAAALVDVVLHKGYDLLELVVQLGAPRRRVGLQGAHHLRRRRNTTQKGDFERPPSVFTRRTLTREEGGSRRREKGERRRNDPSAPASSPASHACLHTTKALLLFTYLQNPHLLSHSCPIVVTVSVGFMGS